MFDKVGSQPVEKLGGESVSSPWLQSYWDFRRWDSQSDAARFGSQWIGSSVGCLDWQSSARLPNVGPITQA